MKWKISRHRGGSGDKRAGSEVASIHKSTLQPPKFHPVAEGRLVSTRWLASRGPPEGRLCVGVNNTQK